MENTKFETSIEFLETGEEIHIEVVYNDNIHEVTIPVDKTNDKFIDDCIIYGLRSRVKSAMRVIVKEKEPEDRLNRLLLSLQDKKLLLRAANSEKISPLTKSGMAYMQVIGKDIGNLEHIDETSKYLANLSKEDRRELLTTSEVKIQMTKNKLKELESEL